MADNNNNGNSSSDSNNDPLDNQARQKQDIKRLLAGQSVSPPPLASTLPTTTTNNNDNDKSEASPSTTATPQPLREDKLKLAVSFLSSPKVQAADKSKKNAFLKQKGLTDAEVEEAYRRSSGSKDNGTSSTTPQVTATPTTIPTRPSPPVSSTLPPVVPTRVPPTRPTQIVYYSEPDPPRLTGRRMLALALLFGAGAVGLTAGLVGIVRGFISPIFNSIAGYQRNRYNDRNEKLSKLNHTLRLHLPEEAPLDVSNRSNDTGYWSPLLTEQRTLMERLERLVQLSQKCADQEEPYGKFKNTLLDLKEVLNRPEYNFSTYTPYSMYGSTFANRSNTGFDDTAVQGVKSEIRSFKGMLLSRRNFPTAQVKPAATPSPPPSAPPPADTPQAYHPRQRQTPSYRSDLQAKPEEQDTAKGNTTSIEDITEQTDK